jgi:hypothetical protein
LDLLIFGFLALLLASLVTLGECSLL